MRHFSPLKTRWIGGLITRILNQQGMDGLPHTYYVCLSNISSPFGADVRARAPFSRRSSFMWGKRPRFFAIRALHIFFLANVFRFYGRQKFSVVWFSCVVKPETNTTKIAPKNLSKLVGTIISRILAQWKCGRFNKISHFERVDSTNLKRKKKVHNALWINYKIYDLKENVLTAIRTDYIHGQCQWIRNPEKKRETSTHHFDLFGWNE